MTNDPRDSIDADALADALVELSSPDGTVYRFRYGAVLPYAGQEYVVLVELEDDPNGEEQLLITRLSESDDHELSFEVVTEDDIIQAILQKYTEKQIHDVMEEDEGGCCCGHEHSHEHQDGCCGHDHSRKHQDGCGCHVNSHEHQDGCCGCSH